MRTLIAFLFSVAAAFGQNVPTADGSRCYEYRPVGNPTEIACPVPATLLPKAVPATQPAPPQSVIVKPGVPDIVTKLSLAQFVAGGCNWNQTASPQISCGVSYAYTLSAGTYTFSAFDVTSTTIHPFTTAVMPTTGLAQHMRDIGPISVFILGSVGVLSGGTNTGLAWTAGGVAWVPIGSKGFGLLPNLRVYNSAVTHRNEIVVGVWLGWGKVK